jgi:hypothetical protein
MDAAKLKELGLTESARALDVVSRGTHHRFKVAPSVAGMPYLESEADGKVYVLSSSLISELDAASTRLVERRLHKFRGDEVESLTVESQGKKRDFEQKGTMPGAARLFPKGSDAPDAFAKNWSDKLMRLFPIDILGRGETPVGGEPQVQLSVRYQKGGKPLGHLELGHQGTDLYARTELTAGWVKLPANSDDVLHESAKVLNP